jgi:hypothetical protein
VRREIAMGARTSSSLVAGRAAFWVAPLNFKMPDGVQNLTFRACNCLPLSSDNVGNLRASKRSKGVDYRRLSGEAFEEEEEEGGRVAGAGRRKRVAGADEQENGGNDEGPDEPPVGKRGGKGGQQQARPRAFGGQLNINRQVHTWQLHMH